MQGNATIDAARSWFDMIAKTPPQAGLANEHATPRTLDTNDQTADQRAVAEALRLLDLERLKAE